MEENNHPTEQEIAAIAKQFLERVQLAGHEVPAFNAVSHWLTQHERPNT